MTKRALTYWMINYRPRWEAVSKEVEALIAAMDGFFDVNFVSFNFKEKAPRFQGKFKRLPLPLCLPALPIMARQARQNGINHVFCGPAERFLAPRLASDSAVVTISKNTKSMPAFERNLENLRRFRYVVVESERDREILHQAGLSPESVKLIYPGFEKKDYVPAEGPFSMLFATAPFGSHDFLNRGVFLMLHVAQRLPEVRFRLVWRENDYERLMHLIKASGVTNMDVHNGYIPDMDALYRTSHATILPGLDEHSLKPCPHSAIESLAHGKPLLVSRPTSLAGLVDRTETGVVFEPTLRALEAAIVKLRSDYERYQGNCQKLVLEKFSPEGCMTQYRKLYESMG
ncbi:MAG: glycosyltransferase family 4 protein [bacterium]|nr:glycosyltransferase family 4 protein [bacterium]